MSRTPVIAVVDDDVAILEVISLVLEDEGYQVATNTGAQVDQFIDQLSPDLILLDVWMQGLDGRDVARRLKNQTDTADTPIILMSAHSEAIGSLKSARADSFLEKPFGMDELLQAVTQFIKD